MSVFIKSTLFGSRKLLSVNLSAVAGRKVMHEKQTNDVSI